MDCSRRLSFTMFAPLTGNLFSLQLDGDCTVGGRIAYVPQNPWIQNLPLKENVLFGEAYDEDKYNATIDACALRFDLGILPKVHIPVLSKSSCVIVLPNHQTMCRGLPIVFTFGPLPVTLSLCEELTFQYKLAEWHTCALHFHEHIAAPTLHAGTAKLTCTKIYWC
jgi:hypothetical protein